MTVATAPEPPLEWPVNPWHEAPRRAALAVVAIALVGALLAALTGSALWTLALALAFALSLGAGILPLRCRVDGEGVAVRRLGVWERRAWSAIRRARLSRGRSGAGHLFVTPEERASALDRYRGLGLPVPRGLPQRERILEELGRRLALHGF